jgi:hypothetical protein
MKTLLLLSDLMEKYERLNCGKSWKDAVRELYEPDFAPLKIIFSIL